VMSTEVHPTKEIHETITILVTGETTPSPSNPLGSRPLPIGLTLTHT